MRHFTEKLIAKAAEKQQKSSRKRAGIQNRYSYKERACSVYYASQNNVSVSADTSELAAAGLGFLPISIKGFPIEKHTGADKDWTTRYGFLDWKLESWKRSHGVQIYTGLPSGHLTDLDFEFAIIRDYPLEFLDTLNRLCGLTEKPLVTLTKSGGVRFTCRTEGYVHPRKDVEDIFRYKPERESNGRAIREALYLEIFGDKGLSRWDSRYEILRGSLFAIPTLDPGALFSVLDTLKRKIHVPKPPRKQAEQTEQTETAAPKAASQDIIHLEDVDGLPVGLTWVSTGEGEFKSAKGNYPCKVTKHRKSHGAAQYYRDEKTGGISAYCHNCKGRWVIRQPTLKQKTIKLHKRNVSLILDTLDASREKIEAAFDDNKRVIGLRADTGTGKSEAMISYVLRSGCNAAVNLPNKSLASELHQRFDKAEIPVFSYRGVSSNPEGAFPNESPCAFPQLYEAYSIKGGNAVTDICMAWCPHRAECEQAGHLWELRQLNKHQVIVTTFPQLWTEPSYRGWIRAYFRTLKGADIVIHDDADLDALFINIEVKRAYLEGLSKMHRGHEAGDFADILLSLLHRENMASEIMRFIAEITGNEREAIKHQLAHIRTDSGALLTLSEAVEAGLYHTKNEFGIAAIPKIAREPDWTLLNQLELFYEAYQNSDTAPINYNSEHGALSFFLHPMLPKTNERHLFMSASYQRTLFDKTFKHYERDFVDTHWTAWHPDAAVYQLATNRNPRATVLTEQGQLSKTGESYFDACTEIIQRVSKQRHGLITYKQVLAEKADILSELGVVSAHYGGLVGLDERFKAIDMLHILFAPEIGDEGIRATTRLFFGDDEVNINWTLADGTYVDARAFAVKLYKVIGEIEQAVGRGRLVNNPIKVFIYSSHELPSISQREQTYHITEKDLSDWNDTSFETLQKIIADNEKQRAEIQKAVKAGDVKQVQELDGVNQRAAYYQIQKANPKSKVERDAEIYRLYHTEKMTQQEIADRLGIKSKSTVSRVLKKLNF